jgi:hypothetical protein
MKVRAARVIRARAHVQGPARQIEFQPDLVLCKRRVAQYPANMPVVELGLANLVYARLVGPH